MPEPEPKVESLTRRAVRAGTSMAFMSGLEALLVFTRTLILSRLLSPHDFGLMGMAFVAVATTNALSQTGFGRAVVQRKDDPGPYLDTLWCVSAIRGVILSLVLMAIAPLLGLFFRTPEVVPILRLIAIGPAITGLVSARWVVLERELRLGRYAIPRVAAAGADLCITTILAWNLRNVHALAAGYLIFSAVLAAVTFAVAPFVPRLRIDGAQVRQLYGFGKHIFRFDAMAYAIEQLDRIVIGRLRDATQLGFYSFAWRMATIPSTLMFTILISVVFPSFARIQDDRTRARSAYVRLASLMAALVMPVAAGLFLVADVLVQVAFGTAWLPMVPAFRALSMMACFVTMGQVAASLTAGLGMPVMAARAQALRLGILALLVVPATLRYGIEGAAWCAAAAALASLMVLLGVMARHLELPAGRHVILFGIPLLSCLVMAATVTLSGMAVTLPAPVELMSKVIVGAAAYVVCSLILDRLTGAGLLEAARAVVRAR